MQGLQISDLHVRNHRQTSKNCKSLFKKKQHCHDISTKVKTRALKLKKLIGISCVVVTKIKCQVTFIRFKSQ